MTQHETMIQTAANVEEKSKRERDRIFDAMAIKADAIRQLRLLFKITDTLATQEEVAKMLDEQRQAFFKQCQPAMLDLAQEALTLARTFYAAKAVLVYPIPEGKNEDDTKQWDRFAELISDHNVLFSMNYLNVLEQLEKFHARVLQWKEDPEKLYSILSHHPTRPVERSHITRIDFLPFCVDVEVSDEGWNFEKEKTFLGFHMSGYPINVLREKISKTKMVRNHEHIHTILDGMALTHDLGVDKNVKAAMAAVKEKAQDGERLEDEMAAFANRLDTQIILRAINEEFLAELEKSEENEFCLPKDRLLNPFQQIAGATSTAGGKIRRITKALIDESNQTANAKAWEIRNAYVKMARTAKIAVTIARKIDRHGDALGDVHALLLILEPKQYTHIVRFLERRYPGPSLRHLEESLSVVERFNFYPQEMFRLKQTLDNMDQRLHPFAIEQLKRKALQMELAVEDTFPDRKNIKQEDVKKCFEDLLTSYRKPPERLRYLFQIHDLELSMRKHIPSFVFPCKDDIRWFALLELTEDAKKRRRPFFIAGRILNEKAKGYLKDEIMDEFRAQLKKYDKDEREAFEVENKLLLSAAYAYGLGRTVIRLLNERLGFFH